MVGLPSIQCYPTDCDCCHSLTLGDKCPSLLLHSQVSLPLLEQNTWCTFSMYVFNVRKNTGGNESSCCTETLLCPHHIFFKLCSADIPASLSNSRLRACKSSRCERASLCIKSSQWLNQIEKEVAVQPFLQSSTSPRAALPVMN